MVQAEMTVDGQGGDREGGAKWSDLMRAPEQVLPPIVTPHTNVRSER